jgi:hypothetical protein
MLAPGPVFMKISRRGLGNLDWPARVHRSPMLYAEDGMGFDHNGTAAGEIRQVHLEPAGAHA